MRTRRALTANTGQGSSCKETERERLARHRAGRMTSTDLPPVDEPKALYQVRRRLGYEPRYSSLAAVQESVNALIAAGRWC